MGCLVDTVTVQYDDLRDTAATLIDAIRLANIVLDKKPGDPLLRTKARRLKDNALEILERTELRLTESEVAT